MQGMPQATIMFATPGDNACHGDDNTEVYSLKAWMAVMSTARYSIVYFTAHGGWAAQTTVLIKSTIAMLSPPSFWLFLR